MRLSSPSRSVTYAGTAAATFSSIANRDGATIAPSNADWLPDETPVRSLCPRMVCTACGLIGADVRPDWSPPTNGRHPGPSYRRPGCDRPPGEPLLVPHFI